jgi:hypothetical protein
LAVNNPFKKIAVPLKSMKKYLVLSGLLILVQAAFSQTDSTRKPPYLQFPTYPPVKLLMADSSSFYTKADLPKKSAIMLMLFSPQCEHCQHETEQIVAHIDEFKKVQIVMATFMPFDSMMAFREKYGLKKYKNIVVGQDTHYFLPTYYKISNLPFFAFYNKDKELISVHEGSMPIESLLNVFH